MTLSQFLTRASTLTAVALLGACASVAVTDDAIVQRTATALSQTPANIKITNRVNEGIKTSYLATTADGKAFNCYVTGSVGVTGRVVSDALCTPAAPGTASGAAPAAAAAPAATTTCNALLKAAGKC
jgi:hypothetical protein